MKEKMNKKEIIITVLLLIIGAALTAASLCIYYLVKPRSAAILSVVCVVDFLYTLFLTCLFFKFMSPEKWLLKGALITVGYTAAFIVVAVLFILLTSVTNSDFIKSVEFLKNNILGVVFYSFFTGPCIFIVIALALLCLAYG